MASSSLNECVLDQIRKDNEYFKSLFNSIPPAFYFDNEAKELLHDDENETTQLAESKGQRQLSAKTIKKALNLDPSKILSVTELQSILAQREDNEGKIQHSSANNNLRRLEELQSRLQTRLEELRGKRKSATGKDVPRNRLTRKQSKLKQQLKKTTLKLQQAKTGNPNKSVKPTSNTKGTPIVNKDGKLVFSKFDFIGENDRDKPNTTTLTGKNYKKLLQSTEKQQQKLKLLEQNDKEEAKSVKEKTAWKKAVQKASGIKIKDNPELLKKAIKRKEKKKNKSRKQWDERNKQVQMKKEKRQEKRQRNISKKKQSRIDKKVNKAKKKGHIIPGF